MSDTADCCGDLSTFGVVLVLTLMSVQSTCVLPQVLGLLDEMHREGVAADEVTTLTLYFGIESSVILLFS